MNAEIKKRWVEALRSGQYKQIKGGLTDGRGFCCLGVLCNLHALEVGVMWERHSDYGRPSYAKEIYSLPLVVREWAGLHSSDPQVSRHTLARWNDHKGASFKEIADLIEKRL